MIVGAVIIPAAPLLVPGVSASLPAGLPRVCDAIDAVLEGVPACDLIVLVAAGAAGLHDTGSVNLAGIGRPDIVVELDIDTAAASRLSAAAQYPMFRGGELPLDLAVLALHVGDAAAIVPMSVPATADFDALVGVGATAARVFSDPDLRVVVIAAGDLSAGLTEKSPLHLVSGAIFWDEQAVAVVDSGRLDGLARLGPDEARRVGARGWPALAVLHGAVASAKLGMIVRHYAAPRGVGYLVASGA